MSQTKIKHIIAVASGKGGVGKSTIAVNLALSLKELGYAVGILDADIYGPSLPTLLGQVQAKPVIENKTIAPIESYGIKSMSIGYLVDIKASLAWRGPMLGKALEQLLNDTLWGELDYLVVDLPPGTGDIQLTLCQKIAVSGAVIVTTPQDVALVDVRRACEMFNKLNVPILGVIENMSVFHCSHCGASEKIFGEGGGKKLSAEYDLRLLGQLPLQKNICELGDGGKGFATGEFAHQIKQIATLMLEELAKRPKDYSKLFPKIVVENKGNA